MIKDKLDLKIRQFNLMDLILELKDLLDHTI